ncbi:MAG: DUF2793 domain-containing protein [Roseovarius sp.]
MSDITARLDLPLIQPSQAQKHVTHNEALQVLDGLVQAALEETGANAPPFEPVTGTLYAIGPNPTDAWAGEANKLALRITEAWLFIDPQTGWRAWDKATEQFKVFDGTGWAEIRPDLNNLDGVGIGTASDTTNRLAVASAATLLSHEGAGHQLKVNKSAAGDTASLLFQSNWTGHAEMGLAGDTAFSVKVSDDGTTWHEALRADPATQQIETDFQLTGDAVQQSPTDTTAGRLMRADYGFGPGNLLGTVTQSGGTPTGAVIERGSNANGDYVRFADGTQICGKRRLSGATGAVTWTYPAAFDQAPTVQGGLTKASLSGGGAMQSGLSGTMSCDVQAFDSSGAAVSTDMNVFAFGRWF